MDVVLKQLLINWMILLFLECVLLPTRSEWNGIQSKSTKWYDLLSKECSKKCLQVDETSEKRLEPLIKSDEGKEEALVGGIEVTELTFHFCLYIIKSWVVLFEHFELTQLGGTHQRRPKAAIKQVFTMHSTKQIPNWAWWEAVFLRVWKSKTWSVQFARVCLCTCEFDLKFAF